MSNVVFGAIRHILSARVAKSDAPPAERSHVAKLGKSQELSQQMFLESCIAGAASSSRGSQLGVAQQVLDIRAEPEQTIPFSDQSLFSQLNGELEKPSDSRRHARLISAQELELWRRTDNTLSRELFSSSNPSVTRSHILPAGYSLPPITVDVNKALPLLLITSPTDSSCSMLFSEPSPEEAIVCNAQWFSISSATPALLAVKPEYRYGSSGGPPHPLTTSGFSAQTPCSASSTSPTFSDFIDLYHHSGTTVYDEERKLTLRA